MVAKNARDVLKDENKLLVDLEKTASSNPVGQDWARFFREWRGTVDALIRQSDSGLNQGLDDEIKRLEKMRNSIAGDSSAGTKFWVDMLNLDIEGAEALKL
jgi:hypothetical protein